MRRLASWLLCILHSDRGLSLLPCLFFSLISTVDIKTAILTSCRWWIVLNQDNANASHFVWGVLCPSLVSTGRFALAVPVLSGLGQVLPVPLPPLAPSVLSLLPSLTGIHLTFCSISQPTAGASTFSPLVTVQYLFFCSVPSNIFITHLHSTPPPLFSAPSHRISRTYHTGFWQEALRNFVNAETGISPPPAADDG